MSKTKIETETWIAKSAVVEWAKKQDWLLTRNVTWNDGEFRFEYLAPSGEPTIFIGTGDYVTERYRSDT